MSNNIAIRVDASNQIGTGHFMRCLTLADALKKKNIYTRFVSRDLPEFLQECLKEKGHDIALLESIHANQPLDELQHARWLGTDQNTDAKQTSKKLSDRKWDWLIVDHYALDVRWESIIRQTVSRIFVIDDIADRVHECDVLLDQNFYTDMSSRYVDKTPRHCKLLLGPRYALLREEFSSFRKNKELSKKPVNRVLLFFGGMDSDNYTGRVLQVLIKMKIPGLNLDVVIGETHPCREQIEVECAKHNFECHVQTRKIASLMAKADLAIGAGGTATWERCCLGLATIAIAVADNQRKQIADSAAEGLIYSPEICDNFSSAMQRHISALLENENLRYFLSHNGMQVADGRGVSRVIRRLGITGVELREACHSDSKKLYEWRNDPSVRSVSRNKGVIKWESHQEWINTVIQDPDKMLLIGECNGNPVGVVRFDVQFSEVEVSIYLVPGASETASGSDLLQSAENWLIKKLPEVSKIRANVLGENIRSHKLFSGMGYQVESTCYIKRFFKL